MLPGFRAGAAPSALDDIRTDVDEVEGLAYQDLGELDPDVRAAAAVDLDGEQEGASLAAGAAAAVSAVGAAAAGALAAGVVEAAAFTGRVLTPRAKVRGGACCVVEGRVLPCRCVHGTHVGGCLVDLMVLHGRAPHTTAQPHQGIRIGSSS